jgi:hypothetical protein
MKAKRRVTTASMRSSTAKRPAGAKRTPTVRRIRSAIVQPVPRPRVEAVSPSSGTQRSKAATDAVIDADLSVDLGRGLVLPNPILVASGTFGYGIEYGDVVEVDRLGAI